MSPNSPPLEGMKLFVPDLAKHEWASAIEEAEGTEAEIITLQWRMVLQLQPLMGAEPTAENLGWLALWSRGFNCLDGALGAMSKDSAFTLDLLARPAFELTLHVGVVLDPMLRGATTLPTLTVEERWVAARDRLCGYVAWALMHDLRHDHDLLRPEVLAGVFDRGPARTMVAQLGAAREAWEREMGEIPQESDAEVELSRQRAERYLRERVGRMERWLENERLIPWATRLRERRTLPSLYALFDHRDSGVWHRLQGLGLPYGYSTYVRGSHAVHGSSLEHALLGTQGLFVPAFGDVRNAAAQTLGRVLSDVQWAAFLLGFAAPYLTGTGAHAGDP